MPRSIATPARRTPLDHGLILALAVLALLLGESGVAHAEDWPVHQHDNSRSGLTAERLSLPTLAEAWRFESPQAPQPAWAAPAKWDAYAGIRGLRSMRNYDVVFHPIVAGESVYFGSSVDDAVHCLDASTGRERWRFTTDGPVRIAPSFHQGRLYFGSDDGNAYCVDAVNGELVWKFRPIPPGRLILNNGRFIPLWPCRTGVLVDGDTAYFAVGMLPWEPSYLCAVDALTGQPEGPGRFIHKVHSSTFEGSLLASATKLIAPQGRVPPVLFDRRTGRKLGALEGGGGCFVLLTDDEQVLHGPGNKTGWITASQTKDRTKIASFDNANAMVVRGQVAYQLTDNSLAALDRARRVPLWQQPCKFPFALILAGDHLVAGGLDEVAAFTTEGGEPIWRQPISGRAYGLAAANGALFVSTDQGTIHCFRQDENQRLTGTLREVRVDDRTLTPEEVTAHAELNRIHGPSTIKLAVGPALEFLDRERARVWWRTAHPSPSILEYGLEGGTQSMLSDLQPKIDHSLTLTGLRSDAVYHYRIKTVEKGAQGETAPFECDTFCNYSVNTFPRGPSPYGADEFNARYVEAAKQILARSSITQGVCFVLDCGRGQLAYELARQSQLRVIAVDSDPSEVRAARAALNRAGVYGARVSVRHVAADEPLPFTKLFANLIVSDGILRTGAFPVQAAEALACLRPGTGVALFGAPHKGLSKSWPAGDRSLAVGFQRSTEDGWIKIVRADLPGTGLWSHEYGTAANAAYAGESLQGASGTGDLEVQWVGQPGPRAQPDRNGRKPSPLSTGGRLFVQGLHRLIALDAYNGSVLWSWEIPPLQRFNMPRDCGNWCADTQHVFAAIDGQTWKFDAATGRISRLYDVVPGPDPGCSYDWGYLSTQDSLLIGTAVRTGTAYTEFWGGSTAGWYDAKSGPVTYKVCTENIFALDQATGQVAWNRVGGVIIHSTITIAGSRVFFVESRHPKLRDLDTHRIGAKELWEQQYLVGLNLGDGQVIFEQPIQPTPGEVAFYLAHAQDKLVLTSSGAKQYSVYAFNDADGAAVWETAIPWPSDHHGGHMSRPAIVGDTVYVRPKALALGTGKVLDLDMPGGGCGTYAASDKALFFRSSNVTVWDRENGSTTAWNRLRPDCWLSTIPAAGLLLSPEAGGGCSCGSWMETSIVFVPVELR